MRFAIFCVVMFASAAAIAATIQPIPPVALLAILAASAGMFEAYEDGFFDSAQPVDGFELVLRLIAGGAYVVALLSSAGLLVEGLLK